MINEPVGRYAERTALLPDGEKPYSPFLGFDIPVKTTKKGPDGKDMFIQKESGLFVPETRGNPTLEQRRALPPGQKKLTDFFRDNL